MADNLSKYRAKRDFKKTSEPSGQAHVKRPNRRRFVIQKHHATRLHYDLRLELDRRGTTVAARATRRHRLDAAQLDAGEVRSRPEAVWRDYCDGERPLEQAIKRLGKSILAA